MDSETTLKTSHNRLQLQDILNCGIEYIDRLQEKEENTVTKPSSKGEIGFKVGGK